MDEPQKTSHQNNVMRNNLHLEEDYKIAQSKEIEKYIFFVVYPELFSKESKACWSLTGSKVRSGIGTSH